VVHRLMEVTHLIEDIAYGGDIEIFANPSK